MTTEALKDQSKAPIIEITLDDLQTQAKKDLGRYLTRAEIENAVDLQIFAISQLISLTVELSSIEPSPD